MAGFMRDYWRRAHRSHLGPDKHGLWLLTQSLQVRVRPGVFTEASPPADPPVSLTPQIHSSELGMHQVPSATIAVRKLECVPSVT